MMWVPLLLSILQMETLRDGEPRLLARVARLACGPALSHTPDLNAPRCYSDLGAPTVSQSPSECCKSTAGLRGWETKNGSPHPPCGPTALPWVPGSQRGLPWAAFYEWGRYMQLPCLAE